MSEVLSKLRLYKKSKFGKHGANYLELIKMGNNERVVLEFSVLDKVLEDEKPEISSIRKHFKELSRKQQLRRMETLWSLVTKTANEQGITVEETLGFLLTKKKNAQKKISIFFERFPQRL